MLFTFFIFSEEKVSSFLFSCISFKYFFLLAFVSEFDCFLRSRCSMEMWCPDDIGRDSWDWVGPPAWGRACFNSPEWGGGSSPVKTEPPQIALLLLLLLLCRCCCVVVVVSLCWCVVGVFWCVVGVLLVLWCVVGVCTVCARMTPIPFLTRRETRMITLLAQGPQFSR